MGRERKTGRTLLFSVVWCEREGGVVLDEYFDEEGSVWVTAPDGLEEARLTDADADVGGGGGKERRAVRTSCRRQCLG